MMLPCDNKQIAEWAADELELDDCFSEVLPGEYLSLSGRATTKQRHCQ